MASPDQSPLDPYVVVEGQFDDIDAMAVSPLSWDQKLDQIGSGHFQGSLTQLVMDRVQVGRACWSPGVLQRGCAPPGTWVFGLPLVAEGSLHIRRRPAHRGELLAATCLDDVAFTATGRTDLMVVVLPTTLIDRWLQQRRGIDKLDVDLASPRWRVSEAEMGKRASVVQGVLQTLIARRADYASERALEHVESQLFDVILDMIPSAEVIEPLHNRARIARAVLALLHERMDDPPTIDEMCVAVGTRERTLHLSCLEAFGRAPIVLLTELRLNAVRRALMHPNPKATVTSTAAHYGFNHFGRFAEVYRRKFSELPSATFAKGRTNLGLNADLQIKL